MMSAKRVVTTLRAVPVTLRPLPQSRWDPRVFFYGWAPLGLNKHSPLKIANTHKLKHIIEIFSHTSWFEDEASAPVPSAPYIIKLLGMLLTCCILFAGPIPSPGVWVDGGELGEGPTVLHVPVLFAGQEEECCFIFLLLCWGRNEKKKRKN